MKKKRYLLIPFAIIALIGLSYPAWSVYYDGYFTNVLVKGNVVVNTTDAISASTSRSFPLSLAEAFIDGTGVMGNDGTTAPGLAEHDNIPAIVYASSGETTKIQWTFRKPTDYSTGLAFRVLLSSSVASGAQQSIDWQLWINEDDGTFDAAAVAQTAVAGTSATLDASNEEVTLTVDSTGLAAISAATNPWITLDIWNAGSCDGTTELKGIQGLYTAAR